MTNEIKEILDRLERIDHKAYNAFDFADCADFDDVARCFDERKKLADYITNLQQENEHLKKNQRFHKKFGNDYIFCVEGDKETYKDLLLEKQEENEELQDRINKALEYIDNHTIEWIDKHFEEHNVMVAFNEYSNPQALKDILQGDDNESNN